MRDRPPRVRDHGALGYVLLGLAAGIGYAVLNTYTDDWANAGTLGRAFAAFHAFVDRGLPMIAGALVGLALHWTRLRARLAAAEGARAEELRSRLGHVERDQAVWVVAAAALHELKTPLHALGLLVEELEEAAPSGDPHLLRELSARIREQMTRALVPLRAIRTLARPGRRQGHDEPGAAVVSSVVEALRPIAQETGVTLRIEGSRRVSARATADAEYLRIILDNLIVNALEGSPEGGRPRNVVVLVDETSERFTVRVNDDGPGLSEERRQHLFEPLHTDKSRGLGLGLPIARALARSIGGELALRTGTGYSTTFELNLPLASELAPDHDGAPPLREPEPA